MLVLFPKHAYLIQQFKTNKTKQKTKPLFENSKWNLMWTPTYKTDMRTCDMIKVLAGAENPISSLIIGPSYFYLLGLNTYYHGDKLINFQNI